MSSYFFYLKKNKGVDRKFVWKGRQQKNWGRFYQTFNLVVTKEFKCKQSSVLLETNILSKWRLQ